jgi:hypothetical protein
MAFFGLSSYDLADKARASLAAVDVRFYLLFCHVPTFVH